MLKAYACETGRLVPLAPADFSRAVWFDLESPSAEEYAFVARQTGLSLPTLADLTEIESSSRLASDGPVLTLSLPIVTHIENILDASVCGFVLSPALLITLRFAPSIVFNQFPTQPHILADSASAALFAGLLEAIVDRQADALERLRAELDDLSHKIFHHRLGSARQRSTEADLQAMLIMLGRDYDSISFLRDSQLGVARLEIG
ncbi:MAG: CorA family divalent cation transporter, partial [Acidocella sp.]|nr:CorA family divalent cation transporter [Acidocella sp.]